MESNTINIGRKRDPNGYFVAVLASDTYDKLKDVIDKMLLSNQILIDRAGNMYIIRSKSWNTMSKLVNAARQRGIRVEERKL